MLVVDILITGIIAHGLWKSKTGWKHTDALIKRVIMCVPQLVYFEAFAVGQTNKADRPVYRFSAEAQFPPAIMALAMLITFVVQPDTFLSFFYM